MKNSKNKPNSQEQIDDIAVTSDVMTNRGGLALFSRYCERTGILDHLNRGFHSVRLRNRGRSTRDLIKQVVCFLADGTRSHLTYFDELQRDPGYAAVLETSTEQMTSSHAIKRWVGKISCHRIWALRKVLQDLFIRTLMERRPAVVVLGIDTMVMDNDDAGCREGVKPTYKKVKGFQPLQMYWENRIIDAVFRSGDKHSNHSDTVEMMIGHMVKRIRKALGKDIPIIIRMDSGFFDQAIFTLCETLHVGYICGGKLNKDICKYIAGHSVEEWTAYRPEGKGHWEYIAFEDRREIWEKGRRALYCRPISESSGQGILPFARPDTVIYTNLGTDNQLNQQLIALKQQALIEDSAVLESYHQRGLDELTNRGLKDFHAEQVPFKRFESNMFWYFMILISFALLENFKEAIACPLVDRHAYPTSVRRRVLDIAAKITHHGGRIVLKVTRSTWEAMAFPTIWARINAMTRVF